MNCQTDRQIDGQHEGMNDRIWIDDGKWLSWDWDAV